MGPGVVITAGLVATAAALYASYDGLWHLAELAGWSKSTRKGLPLTLDVAAVAAGVLVARQLGAELRALAWRGVLALVGASIAGNAVYHVYVVTGGNWPAEWMAVLSILVSAVPALAAGYLIHLFARMSAEVQLADAPSEPEPDRSPVPVPQLDNEHQDDAPEAEAETNVYPMPGQREAVAVYQPGTIGEKGIEMLIQLRRARQPFPTPAELALSLGCSDRYARGIFETYRKSA
ncbi:hypothetical protein ACIA8O_39830 [Kitasatospora sp. NPDC051853]|uniref:hypothetical protein n=1 Tax=Kitasatospora sp. NPDC051853 TaxID=3364058 RepID=UPI0037AA257B